MAYIKRVFTLARVAEMLGEDEECVRGVSGEMFVQDGKLALVDVGDVESIAFTEDGVENLRAVIPLNRPGNT